MKFLPTMPVIATLLYAAPAAAYLDPATGSILLQGLLALLAGAAVTARLYWEKLKRLFRGRSPDSERAADESSPDPEPRDSDRD